MATKKILRVNLFDFVSIFQSLFEIIGRTLTGQSFSLLSGLFFFLKRGVTFAFLGLLGNSLVVSA